MEEDIKTTLEVTKVATDSKTITRETTQVAILLDLMLWVVVVDLQPSAQSPLEPTPTPS